MFDQKYYRCRLLEIKRSKGLTLKKMCSDLGISCGTLSRFLDDSGFYKTLHKTAKKIIEYVEMHYQDKE